MAEVNARVDHRRLARFQVDLHGRTQMPVHPRPIQTDLRVPRRPISPVRRPGSQHSVFAQVVSDHHPQGISCMITRCMFEHRLNAQMLAQRMIPQQHQCGVRARVGIVVGGREGHVDTRNDIEHVRRMVRRAVNALMADACGGMQRGFVGSGGMGLALCQIRNPQTNQQNGQQPGDSPLHETKNDSRLLHRRDPRHQHLKIPPYFAKMNCKGLILAGLWGLLAIGGLKVDSRAQDVLFANASEESGVLAPGIHHGVAWGDYNNDGWPDLYTATRMGPNLLFENQGDGTFVEVGALAGVADISNSMTAVWGDVDNDGLLDLAVGNFNDPNRLYKNLGDGTFADITTSAGIGHAGPCRSLHMADYNADGFLDIYVVNINSANVLFRNNGPGMTFSNATYVAQVNDTQVGMGSLFTDADQDGDIDLYLTHDANQPNKFFDNDGDGTFTEKAGELGLDYVGNCMGVDAGDVNRDGWLDLYISDLYPSELLMANGDGTFYSAGEAAGVDDTGMTWGVVFFDFDNDGILDIYLVNDFLFSPAPNILYRGLADGTFENVSAGDGTLEHPFSDFGLASADYDGDGDLDLAIATTSQGMNPGLQLLRNETGQASGQSIFFHLEGTLSNRDAVGARATIWFGGGQFRVDEIHAGQGYSGHSNSDMHFGLDEENAVDSVVVHWPAGGVSTHLGPFAAGPEPHLILEPGGNPWFSVGCTNPEACNYQPAAANDDGSCEFAFPGFDCEGQPIVGEPSPETHSAARLWNETLLHGIRHDWARPTIHARNLWHASVLMFDAYAAFSPDTVGAPQPFFLGRTVGGYTCPFESEELATPGSEEERAAAREAAIGQAVARLMLHRFAEAPQAGVIVASVEGRAAQLGLDLAYESTDYTTGNLENDARALGNYLAEQMIAFGLQDGSNEQIGYQNAYYNPMNWNLVMAEPGNPNMFFPNRWQPLQLTEFIDQGGNPSTEIAPEFLSPEWGNVTPFALHPEDMATYERLGGLYKVYHDPGVPAQIDPSVETTEETSDYKWGHVMTAVWSSHLSPEDSVMWDISPGAMGRDGFIPSSYEEARGYYDWTDGGLTGEQGHAINPATGEPYPPQWVPRGDFARVLAEYWADGPDSETPPGHWFTVLNYVNDQPQLERRWRGLGQTMDDLTWDVFGYFALGGAMHDAAVAGWGCKGWYDYVRPVSAIRWMADQGQCSDPELPNFHGAGLPLVPGVIELITDSDPVDLTGPDGEYINELKIYCWRGPSFIDIPATDEAGVDWIRVANWWPYQRPTFVTPPFAGYVSGHSTFSRAAAEVLTMLTGDPYFPGGVGEFEAPANEFLVFEDGPSVDVMLQWATYRDAADQSGLSRIWGGIHPPQDDFPGRLMGQIIGIDAFHCAETFARPADALDPCVVISSMDCPGDFNGDGVRGIEDLLSLLVGFSQPSANVNLVLDLTGDSYVTTSDLMVLLSLWGQPC